MLCHNLGFGRSSVYPESTIRRLQIIFELITLGSVLLWRPSEWKEWHKFVLCLWKEPYSPMCHLKLPVSFSFSSNNCVLVNWHHPLPTPALPSLFLVPCFSLLILEKRNVPPFKHQSLHPFPSFFCWYIAPSTVPLHWLLNLFVWWSLPENTHAHALCWWFSNVLAWPGWTRFSKIPSPAYI